jgi:hypothetical protein
VNRLGMLTPLSNTVLESLRTPMVECVDDVWVLRNIAAVAFRGREVDVPMRSAQRLVKLVPDLPVEREPDDQAKRRLPRVAGDEDRSSL